MKNRFKNYLMVIAIIAVHVCSVLSTAAMPKEPNNVAIFLYQSVELLDFAGPGEVFSAAGFRVYTVSVDGKEILSQGFVKILPQYSIENAPFPDILVFPGGNSGPSSKDPKVMEWIHKAHDAGSVNMSVCTGAQILARAGLLEGKNVTTFYGAIPGLQEMLPNSKVLEHTRFVDNGNIITTAGVSAGIDGALHMVSRIKGLDVAKETARYMEYDKWNPEQGRVDYHNEYLVQLRSQANNPAQHDKAVLTSYNSSTSLPYEGEMKNLAFELIDQGKYKEAAYVLETTLKLYPNSASAYSALGKTYKKLGKPVPSDEEIYMKMIREGKIDEAIALYDKDAKAFPGWKLLNESDLNHEGYQWMAKGEYATAIKIFQLNIKAFPQSANAYDSLGEAYLGAGNKAEAKVSYSKSLELDPANDNAKKVLAQMGNN